MRFLKILCGILLLISLVWDEVRAQAVIDSTATKEELLNRTISDGLWNRYDYGVNIIYHIHTVSDSLIRILATKDSLQFYYTIAKADSIINNYRRLDSLITLDAIDPEGATLGYVPAVGPGNTVVWTEPATGGGTGDMQQSIYDTDGNGVVEQVESFAYGNLSGVPTEFPPSAHAHTVSNISDAGNLATLDSAAWTTLSKAVRDSILVRFSGSYNDLDVLPSL